MYKTSKYAHKQRTTSKLSNQTDNKIRIGEFTPGKIFLQKPEQESILLCGTCRHMCAVTCTCYHALMWRPEEVFRSCSITLRYVPLRQGLSVLGAAWRSASANRTEVTGPWNHVQIFTRCWRFKPRSSRLCSKCSYPQSHFLRPRLFF